MQNNYLQFFDNSPDTLLITENKKNSQYECELGQWKDEK